MLTAKNGGEISMKIKKVISTSCYLAVKILKEKT